MEGAELYKHALGIAQEYVRERDCLLVTDEGNTAVNGRHTLLSEGIYLLAEQVLKTEKAGCNKLKFHN